MLVGFILRYLESIWICRFEILEGSKVGDGYIEIICVEIIVKIVGEFLFLNINIFLNEEEVNFFRGKYKYLFLVWLED